MSLKKKKDESVEKVKQGRRGFLKKAVYAAPTLIIMGQLANPTGAKAWDTDPGGPPSKVE